MIGPEFHRCRHALQFPEKNEIPRPHSPSYHYNKTGRRRENILRGGLSFNIVNSIVAPPLPAAESEDKMFANVARRMAFAILMLAVLPGTAHPDDIAAGRDIVVEAGENAGNVINFGGAVIVRGTVHDAVSIGNRVVVESGGEVRGDAVSIGKSLTIRDGSRVGGDAVAVGGNLEVQDSSYVRGDAAAVLGRLHVNPRASVGSDRINIPWIGPEEVAHIRNGFLRVLIFGPFVGLLGAIDIAFLLFFTLIRMLIWLAITLLSYHFAPDNVENMAIALHQRPLATILYGILTILLLPFLFLLLLVSMIGIPLIPVAAAALLLAYLFGTAGAALWAGSLIPGAANRSGMKSAVLGVITVSLLRMIPGAGFILWLLVAASSFGAVAVTRLGGKPFVRRESV
jgi:hypothetical protein